MSNSRVQSLFNKKVNENKIGNINKGIYIRNMSLNQEISLEGDIFLYSNENEVEIKINGYRLFEIINDKISELKIPDNFREIRLPL